MNLRTSHLFLVSWCSYLCRLAVHLWIVLESPSESTILANSQYQALDAYTFWDYNESITHSGSYWIKHEALGTILTVWGYPTGFSWLSLLQMIGFPSWGFIIIMRI